MILVECPKTGDRCLVESAEGYDGWRVICNQVQPPENDDCEWCDKTKKFKRNHEKSKRSDRLRMIRDPESLLDMIESLNARVEALEAQRQ